jgi:phospholipid:diacylglycerol acyltransferase
MASELRRRTVATDTPSDATTPDTGSRDGSPVKISKQDLKAEKHHGHKKETRKRKSTLIFFLGSLFGIIAAGFLARSNDLIEFPEIGELSVDNILEALPAGLVRDMKELVVCLDRNLSLQRRFESYMNSDIAHRIGRRKGFCREL